MFLDILSTTFAFLYDKKFWRGYSFRNGPGEPKKEFGMKNKGWLSFGFALALSVSSAEAFVLTGKVTNEKGSAVKGASVSLPGLELSTTSDGVVKFTLRDTPMSIAPVVAPGFVHVTDGVLSFSQSSSSPVQVQIFDAVGVRVLNKNLQGSGSVDLRGFVKAEGTYFARVKMGSAIQNLKFTANGTYGVNFGNAEVKALRKEAAGENLQVIADGYDTLNVALSNLDTNVVLTLQKAAGVEEQFDFGWAKGNAPVPTRGCGKTWNRSNGETDCLNSSTSSMTPARKNLRK